MSGCWWPWNRVILHCHYCSPPLLSQEEKGTHHIHKISKWTEMAMVAHAFNKRKHGADSPPQVVTIQFQGSGTGKLYDRTSYEWLSGVSLGPGWNHHARPQVSVCVALGQWGTALACFHEKWAWMSFWVLDESLQLSLSSAALSTKTFKQPCAASAHETEHETRVNCVLPALNKANKERPQNIPSLTA